MAQLPGVVVLGANLAWAAALAALVDAGLDAHGLCAADPTPESARMISTFALDARRRLVDAPTGLDVRAGADGGGPFDVVAPTGEPLGRFDAVVVADPGVLRSPPADVAASPAGVAGPAGTGATGTGGAAGRDGLAGSGDPAGTSGPAARFGGVFDPDRDGVFLVGRLVSTGTAGGGERIPTGGAGRELAWAQGGWIGEYLRGRYLLPARSVMLAYPGLPPRRAPWLAAVPATRRGGSSARYLARLDRELCRGRARAAAAGYPLPLASNAHEPSR